MGTYQHQTPQITNISIEYPEHTPSERSQSDTISEISRNSSRSSAGSETSRESRKSKGSKGSGGSRKRNKCSRRKHKSKRPPRGEVDEIKAIVELQIAPMPCPPGHKKRKHRGIYDDESSVNSYYDTPTSSDDSCDCDPPTPPTPPPCLFTKLYSNCTYPPSTGHQPKPCVRTSKPSLDEYNKSEKCW